MFYLVFLIYLAEVFDAIKCLCGISVFIGAVAFVIAFCGYNFGLPEYEKELRNTVKTTAKCLGVTVVICALLLIFLPQRNVMYLFTGAVAIDKISQTETAQEVKDISLKTLKLIKQKLDKVELDLNQK